MESQSIRRTDTINAMTKHLALIWDLVVVVMVFLSGMSIPIGIAVGADGLFWPSVWFALCFSADVLVKLQRRRRPSDQSEGGGKAAVSASNGKLGLIDLISAVASILAAAWIGGVIGVASGWAVFASLIPLSKLLKSGDIYNDLQEKVSANPSLLRLGFFIFWIVLAAHIISLGWIMIGAVPETLSPTNTYITALYWAVTTLSTVGYGDFTPDMNSPIQVVFTMVVMLLGVGMYSYIIGNVATVIANLDAAKASYLSKLEEVNLYMKTRSIPPVLKERVRNYYHYLWETHKSTSTRSILEELPHALGIDIALFLNKDILEKVPYFTNASDLFIREIVQMMELIVFLPGDHIIRQGEYGESMYFMSSGEIDVIIDGEVVAHGEAGSFFGEGALIRNERRNASIRTRTYCDVYRLSRQSFDDLRRKYPDFDQHVNEVFAQRMDENQ